MTSVREIINVISNFKCKIDRIELTFSGILQKKEEKIVLNAIFPIEEYKKMELNCELVIIGKIYDNETTLMGCRIQTASYTIENNSMSLFIIPKEIIVGKCFCSMPVVTRITISTSGLNYMFGSLSLLKPNFVFTKENSSVLNYSFPEPINADDKYGAIKLYQKFDTQLSVNVYTYSITSVIEYSFTKPLVLEDAVMKISVARSLFSFFGNGYIPFGDITFEDDVEKTKYVLYLNYKENIPVVDEPFLITTSMFSGQFQNVWELWLNLYESANPIPRLFYEIICNRSTGINSYLNLSQAIEVYSNTYRNIEANAIAKSDKNNKSKGKNTKLKHRYQDILYTYNSVLKLDEADIENYAHGFSNIRNYYTHYNHGTYVEPSYDELLSAIHILRFILLTIVYTSVGISVDNILECRKIAFFRELDIDASKILKYSKKKRCSFNGNNIEETAKR